METPVQPASVARQLSHLAAAALLGLICTSCALTFPAPAEPAVRTMPVNSKPTGARAAVPQTAAEPDVRIYLLATNIHTGLVFPYDWLLESGFRPPKNFGHPKFVSMSWGDQTAYLQERWLTPWEVFNAFVIGTPSVMEIIPFDWDVVDVCHHEKIYLKLVPRDRGPAVAAFLNMCGKHDSAGNALTIGPSSWGKGVLITCPHKYYLPRVCNVWTAQALQAAGLDIEPWRALSAGWLIVQATARRNGFELIWRGD